MKNENDSKYLIMNYEIDNYINLLRIKEYELGTNKELNYQIKVLEAKLYVLGVDPVHYKK